MDLPRPICTERTTTRIGTSFQPFFSSRSTSRRIMRTQVLIATAHQPTGRTCYLNGSNLFGINRSWRKSIQLGHKAPQCYRLRNVTNTSSTFLPSCICNCRRKPTGKTFLYALRFAEGIGTLPARSRLDSRCACGSTTHLCVIGRSAEESPGSTGQGAR